MIKSFYNSGLQQKEFCNRNNIAYHIIQYWKPIYHKYIKNKNNIPQFVPITGEAPEKSKCSQALPIKIIFNSNLIVEVPIGADPTTLKKIVEVLQLCSYQLSMQLFSLITGIFEDTITVMCISLNAYHLQLR